MKTYFAKKLDNDYLDSDIYYSEQDAETDNIWIGGNREFIEFNEDLYKSVIDAIEDSLADFAAMEDPEEMIEGESEDEILEERNSIIEYYFGHISLTGITRIYNDRVARIVSDNEETFMFTDMDFVNLYDCCNRYGEIEDEELVAQVLSIIAHKPYECTTLRGCAQRDWIRCVYPKELEHKLDYIEAVYFNTGYEYEVTVDPMDEVPDFDLVATYTFYTTEYDEDKIKKDLLDQMGEAGETSEIVIVDEDYFVDED